tara:strand:+ start:36808 stop:38055 length:1248 start_codon:yes stop_codon:yes gene_type:complete
MDLGGVIDHTEQLIGGLKDLGHNAELKELVWAFKAPSQNKTAEWSIGPSGIPHHQGKGWNFDQKNRIPYRGAAATNAARQILSGYDLIIWTMPVPSKNKDNVGNDDWPQLYSLPERIKQVAFIHDGNAVRGAGHLLAIQEYLSGLACVHPCALNGAAFADVPRALVVNPQENPVRPHVEWSGKTRGFVNMQTFKAWKHVHELVEAIGYMHPKGADELREVAGLGIEYRYMTSEEKCKDAYFHGERFNHAKFWDIALAQGMTHHDYWDKDQVDNYLGEARVLIDPSWSKNYSKIGGHFNRVAVDAMMRGCVVIAREKGMGSELFLNDENYVAIPENADAQEYADIIEEVSNFAPSTAKRMIDANREILPMFDRKTVAQRVIDLANGEIEVEEVQGTASDAMKSKVQDILFDHFGVI